MYESLIMYPRPNSPETISAATSENQATPILISRPVKTKGKDPGMTTCKNKSIFLAPRHFAALKKLSSIESTPSKVFNVVTNNEARVARKITGVSNPENINIANGTQASIGIGLNVSKIGNYIRSI